MNHDDYPSGEDTPTKGCHNCKEKGWKLLRITVKLPAGEYRLRTASKGVFLSGGSYYANIPRFIPCERCDGTGYIQMTDDEIEFEQDCRKDDEADLMSER